MVEQSDIEFNENDAKEESRIDIDASHNNIHMNQSITD